jgi:hypothetical protein
MNLGSALKTKWYFKFLPKTQVNSFEVRAWRIIVINSGTTPGKPLLCQRYGDKKTHHFNFQDLEKDFLPEEEFIEAVTKNKYCLINKQEGILKFSSQNS